MRKQLSVLLLLVTLGLDVTGAAIAEEWRSIASNAKAELAVVNRLDRPATISWLDYAGKEQNYGQVRPGQTMTIKSFVTHPWVFKVDGREHQRYRLDTRSRQTVTLGRDALGRLDRNAGRVQYQPINGYAEFPIKVLNSVLQTSSINMVVKPELVAGPDGAKYLHIDLDGTSVSAATGKMTRDDKFGRGWYVERATSRIIATDGRVRHFRSADFSGGGETGSVTSSSTRTLSGSGGFSGKTPSGELGFSNTIGTSYARNLRGFTASTPDVQQRGNRTTVANTYDLTGILFEGDGGLKPYSKAESLVDFEGATDFWGGFASVFSTKAWQSFRLHGLPQVAKKGLPIISQAIFSAGGALEEPVTFSVEIEAKVVAVTVSGHTKLDSKWKSQSRTISLRRDFTVDFGFNYPATS